MAYLDYEGLQHFKDKENEQVAPVESSNTSANAYEIGKYFWHEGNYCKAKTAIAVGDAFVQNTNYTVVKVGEEIEKKANTDGYYEAMTVGNAEQLVATEGVEDSTPYVFRKTGGGGLAIGNREADTLIGGTIAWNQLIQNGNMAADTNWSVQSNATKSFSNNVATMTITSATGAGQFFQMVKVASDHKYLACGYIKPSANKNIYMRFGSMTGSVLHSCVANTWNFIWSIKTPGSIDVYSRSEFNFYIPEGSISVGETYQIKSAICFDLTQMFGATIANYIYSLEQAHAGDGVAWFRKLFQNDYYAYNAGELMSVNTSAHVTTGFNQWDEVWEVGGIRVADGTNSVSENDRIRSKNYIPCVPNADYYYLCQTSNMQILFYDLDKNYLSYYAYSTTHIFTTPLNCYFMRFNTGSAYGTTYNHNICINLSDPAKNGTYEPYDVHTYPLDSELTIRGIPMLDANNNLYYDGDIYEADGTVTRKYGIVDLGTLDWSYPENAFFNTIGLASTMKNVSGPYYANLRCGKYNFIGRVTTTKITNAENLSLGYYGGTGEYAQLRIKDTSYNSASAFKTAVSGVYLVYELASQTTEQAEPYVANQVVSGDGTEEYVDAGVQEETRDVSIPVGHNTVYQQDLRTKLQDAPDSPSEDGDYIMHRVSGHNTYKKGNFAETNGDYPDMTVGNAEQLVSTIGIEDKTPYNFRTSGGSIDIGDRETDMVVGGTIAWNQLIRNGDLSAQTPAWSAYNSEKADFSASNGVATLTYTVAGSGSAYNYGINAPQLVGNTVVGHKYFVKYFANASMSANMAIDFDGGAKKLTANAITENTWVEISNILAASVGGKKAIIVEPYDVGHIGIGDTFSVKNLSIYDLTQMFGSTIADYVYSLEQTTAGAGVAWFKSLFPKPYYEYNAGELLSVNTSAHNMTGFNQWDEQWEVGLYDSSDGQKGSSDDRIRSKNYIPVCPSTQYHVVSSQNVRVLYYDANKNYLTYSGYNNNNTFTTPANCYYLTFNTNGSYGTTYKNDICINLSWDGERDGEYEPYVEYNYPLDSSLELSGIPKLDSANNLYYDGDTYESDGTVTRRYGIVDLGTLTWMHDTSNNVFYSSLSDAKNFGVRSGGYCICSKYNCLKYYTTSGWAALPDKTISVGCNFSTPNNFNIVVVDTSYETADSFKTGVSGIYVVYELATQTTEEASPYQNPQIVDDFGTEEYVDYAESQGTRDVKVPVGHETVYSPNLRAKLETAPDSPQSDGDYIVRQTNGENQYVPLIIPQELPNTPGTDGTYRLQAVVSDGTATLSWVSAT